MNTQAFDATPSSSTGTGVGLASAADVWGALCAALLGGFLIWGVGFSHIDVVHNAAHDVRHSAAFPCH